jgi:drug/metabolite transporter (DMT)-like permease
MSESISIATSLLDDTQKEIKQKNKKYALFCAIFSQFIWAINGIQLKTYRNHFPKQFSLNSLTFWRSIPIWGLGYFFAKKNNIEITPYNKIQSKFWFFARSAGNYLCIVLWIIELSYFRLSTCQCICNCNPVFVLILSSFILREKFYIRYLFGILLSLMGTFMIVLNEKKQDVKTDVKKENKNMLIGLCVASIHLMMVGIVTLGQKMMIKENINGIVQNYFLGMYNTLPAFFVCCFEMHFGFSNILYCIYALSNGFIFYIAAFYQSECLEYMPMSNFLPISYVNIVFIFILGLIFLGENIFITDILGSLLILGFQIYNIYVPIKK